MSQDQNKTPSTPVETNIAKKRQLSSPFSPEDKVTKKTKPHSTSSTDSFGDLMESVNSTETETMALPQFLTLPDSELQKVCDIIKPSIHVEVLTAIAGDIKTLIKDAVAEVIDDKLKNLYAENKRISKENVDLKKRVAKLEQSIDDAEQYSRRNCLRISNFPENQNEDTDNIVLKIADTLNVNILPADIDRSHRVGKPGNKARRDIIVKLSTYRARERLIGNRKHLKNSELDGIFLNEDLTKIRSSLLYEARKLTKGESPSLQGAWTSDGRILLKDRRGKVHRISSQAEIDTVAAIEPEEAEEMDSASVV